MVGRSGSSSPSSVTPCDVAWRSRACCCSRRECTVPTSACSRIRRLMLPPWVGLFFVIPFAMRVGHFQSGDGRRHRGGRRGGLVVCPDHSGAAPRLIAHDSRPLPTEADATGPAHPTHPGGAIRGAASESKLSTKIGLSKPSYLRASSW